MASRFDKAALVLFVLGACLLSFIYGYISYGYRIFPYNVFRQAVAAYRELVKAESPSFYRTDLRPEDLVDPGAGAQPGLTLMTFMNRDDAMNVRVVDLDGAIVYDRTVDWFTVWPDPAHLREDEARAPGPDLALPGALPKSRPGTHIHGIALLDNGDFVLNFEHLGMVRLDPCGRPVWRLPYRTHHSIHVDDGDGTIWVSGQINRYDRSERLPNHIPPFVEYTALQVSRDGKILKEYSIPDLLRMNGLTGLLHMSNVANRRTDVTGDTLHLNDVETFPVSMDAGRFRRGDVMVSLRNINAVLVFDGGSGEIGYVGIGMFVRQHDPDFLDGDTISVFDNNNLMPGVQPPRSRIVIVRPGAAGGSQETYYDGRGGKGFSTAILGKHQWLPNGNVLIVESQRGRAFEIDRDRRVVWEYVNFVGDGRIGLMQEAQRLGPRFDRAFFARATEAC